jgi:hypothetical protein
MSVSGIRIIPLASIPLTFRVHLIAIAVALTTQCPYCIEIHSRNQSWSSSFSLFRRTCKSLGKLKP